MAEPLPTRAASGGARPEPRPGPTALLLGSYKFEKSRPVRGGPDGPIAEGRLHRKGGRKKVFTKAGEVPPQAWLEGDLKNMERYVFQKEMHWVGTLDYRERDEETGEYADGKNDILDAVRNFFAQDDRTEFVLYFSGHGDTDGSWCIPVTELKLPERDGRSRAVSFAAGATPGLPEQVDPAPDNERSETPPPVPKHRARYDVPSLDQRTASISSRASSTASGKPRVPATKEYFDLVTYDDIVRIWDEVKRGRDRKLMLILDCCHSGRWVQMANGECRQIKTYQTTTNADEGGNPGGDGDNVGAANAEPTGGTEGASNQEIEGEITVREPAGEENASEEEDEEEEEEDERPFYQKRDDICVQAACRPVEESMIANNQMSSFFTRAFVAAQSKSTFEKMCISFFDHLFVFGFPSFFCSPFLHPFTPMRSDQPPFADVKFFDSFDDMYLETP